MAATQFELNFARKVFPCWDEPSFKARYNVTIIRKEPFLSLSNMPLKRSENRWASHPYVLFQARSQDFDGGEFYLDKSGLLWDFPKVG